MDCVSKGNLSVPQVQEHRAAHIHFSKTLTWQESPFPLLSAPVLPSLFPSHTQAICWGKACLEQGGALDKSFLQVFTRELIRRTGGLWPFPTLHLGQLFIPALPGYFPGYCISAAGSLPCSEKAGVAGRDLPTPINCILGAAFSLTAHCVITLALIPWQGEESHVGAQLLHYLLYYWNQPALLPASALGRAPQSPLRTPPTLLSEVPPSALP